MGTVQPTQNRIVAIDAIRGFALFGILMVNLLSFHSPHFLYGSYTDYYDDLGVTFIDWFFQASFYPLFSLLFGLGIAIMYDRLTQRGVNPIPVLVRRMLILALFGLLHGIFIWYGDILLTYSFVGLISLLFLSKNGKQLLKWAIGLLLPSTILLTNLLYLGRNQFNGGFISEIQEGFTHYRGDFNSILYQNWNDWLVSHTFMQWVMILFSILPMFLLGMLFYRRGWVNEPTSHLIKIKSWIVFSLILFILLKILPYWAGMPNWFQLAQDWIGGSSSSIFYFLTMLILFNGRKLIMTQRILSKVGRLSLSNYIFQSIVCVFIFYGIGLNLYGMLNIYELMGVGLFIFICQMMFSHWYLKRFKYGPLEWIYRSLTYREKQPMFKRVIR